MTRLAQTVGVNRAEDHFSRGRRAGQGACVRRRGGAGGLGGGRLCRDDAVGDTHRQPRQQGEAGATRGPDGANCGLHTVRRRRIKAPVGFRIRTPPKATNTTGIYWQELESRFWASP